jgi:ATP-dependent Clp protease ATP-binding subunit ClpC
MTWFDLAKEHLAKWKSGLLFAGGESKDLFTPRAIQVVALARKEALRLNHNFIGTEHLLLGLLKLNRGVAVNVLRKRGVDFPTARAKVEEIVSTGTGEKNDDRIPYTPRVKKVFALANRNAKALNHTYIGTEHLLLGLMEETDGVAAKVLRELKVDLQQSREEILKELTPTFFRPDEGQENK